MGFRYKSKGAFAKVQIGDVLFSAVAKGVDGNDISIVLDDTLVNGTASIEGVLLGVITINIEDGATPAGLIVAAVNGDDGEGGAAELVTASLVGDTGDVAQSDAADTHLWGGLDVGADFVAMGAVRGSKKVVTAYIGDVLEAGIAVRHKSDGTLSTTKAHGFLAGVTLGKGLNNLDNATCVCQAGLGVPIKLTKDFVPVIGDFVYVDDVTGLANDDEGEAVTVANGIYVTSMMSGERFEDGEEIPVALIDFKGGL